MQLQQALDILEKHRDQIESQDVKSLSIFGSVARNKATPYSDIDFIVEFDRVTTFDKYMDLNFFRRHIRNQSGFGNIAIT